MYVFLFLITVLILAVLGLCCCTGSSCSEGSALHCGAWASRCGALSSCGEQALGAPTSAAATRGLNGCGAQAQLPRGMPDLPRLGVEPCLQHWQADSYPLSPGKYSCVLKVVTFPNLCCSLHLEGTGGASGHGARIS